MSVPYRAPFSAAIEGPNGLARRRWLGATMLEGFETFFVAAVGELAEGERLVVAVAERTPPRIPNW